MSEKPNNYMNGLFNKIETTLQNMNSIAEFNRIVKNYIKINRLLKQLDKPKK
jgi:hypothetical protein